MGDMARYLDELDAKSQDYAVRVQIACAQARQVAVIKESLKTAAPPADAATEAVREDAVEAWARLAVALLSRHESAWDHDPGPGDDDCDEDCRACEYVGLLRTGRSALAARRGDV